MSSSNVAANVEVCVSFFNLTKVFWCLFWLWKILIHFFHNPLTAFDDNLNQDLAYAWSLPTHPTFERKMALIKAVIDKAVASPPYEYPRSRVLYFTRHVRQAIRVSYLFWNAVLPELSIFFHRSASSFIIFKYLQWLHWLLQSSMTGRMRS